VLGVHQRDEFAVILCGASGPDLGIENTSFAREY
jgi:hypothetical protein